MKLKNKRSGEIKEFVLFDGKNELQGGATLKDLVKEWEDYEEPKEYWYIDYNGTVKCFQYLDYDWQEEMQSIGNYFSSEEEAEKAVEKLKAFKRLKDNGMIKYSFHKEKTGIDLDFYTLTILAPRDKDSLNLLFGDEE
mgnify:CR=1 FL=1